MTQQISLPAPRFARLVLDAHTAPSFPSKYHDGPVEAFVRLDLKRYGLGKRLYAVRMARLLTSERVLLVQEAAPIDVNCLALAGQPNGPVTPILVW